ncbi:hypothetical protein ACFQZV_01960 [Microbacterium koreense]|uniref:VIT family protein n=1 Tax=Microbacterium koreense TaxID=323761 RepID=A0ABW2ZN90_9MICO
MAQDAEDRAHRGPGGWAHSRVSHLEEQSSVLTAYFKERVYASFTGLAIVLVVSSDTHASAAYALLSLVLGVGGIVAAGFVSDVISHLVVHREVPHRRTFALLARIALGGLSTVVVPGLLLVLAWIQVIPVDVALTLAVAVYVLTLVVIGLLAIRGARLTWVQSFVALLILVALGLLVIGLQTLAHSVGGH